MASDEEIARQVERIETARGTGEKPCRTGLEAFREPATDVHDELARRVQKVDDEPVSDEELAAVVERLEDIEARLDEIEERL